MPLRPQIHVDTLLSNVSVKYKGTGHVAMELFPELPVKKSSDLYRVYNRNFRVPETIRANKAEARQHDFEVSTASYVCERHALKQLVSDNEAENYDVADLRVDATEELTDAILRRMEKSMASLLTTTSWSQNLSLAANGTWVDTTTVDPVVHFDTATVTIVNNAQVKPNVAGMGLQVWNGFKNNANVLDRIKYTSKEVGMDVAAAMVGLDKIVLALISEDTAALGIASSISSMWADQVLILYRPERAGPMIPSAGYTFRKAMPLVKRWREEARESEAIEVNMEYQLKVVSSLSGFLINNAI